MRGRALGCVAVVVAAGGGLPRAAPTGPSATATTEAPLPAGPHPSEIAKVVCQHEAHDDIGSALGETATVSTPTWADHLYSCRYRYPAGSFTLSVKELSSWAETDAYYDGLATRLGKTRDLCRDLGQGAFQTTDGSVVVRKDWKVLLVDTSGPSGPVRCAAHQLRRRGRDRGRRHPRVLGRRLSGGWSRPYRPSLSAIRTAAPVTMNRPVGGRTGPPTTWNRQRPAATGPP